MSGDIDIVIGTLKQRVKKEKVVKVTTCELAPSYGWSVPSFKAMQLLHRNGCDWAHVEYSRKHECNDYILTSKEKL